MLEQAGPARRSASLSDSVWGRTGDALESIADGAFGRVAERPRERRNRGVLLPQSPLGEKHPRLRQVGKRSNPGDRLEMEGEGRPGHCGRLGEFLKPPRTAGIAVHQPESASEPPIADRPKPSSRQGAGCFEMRTQNLDERELGELRRRKTGPRKFRRPLADKLVEKP